MRGPKQGMSRHACMSTELRHSCQSCSGWYGSRACLEQVGLTWRALLLIVDELTPHRWSRKLSTSTWSGQTR